MSGGRRLVAALCGLAQILMVPAAPVAAARSTADEAPPLSASAVLLPAPARAGESPRREWFRQEAEGTAERPLLRPPSHRRRWGLAASGAGLAAGVGLAVWLKGEADDRYDLYLRTADPVRARDHFDAAQRYDRATLIGWVVAQASFVGLVYFLIHEEDRPLVPVRGEPLVRAGADGLEVGVVLWP